MVYNGRVTSEFNNFTFIHPYKGSSIVDYFIVPMDTLHKCLELKICTACEMVNNHCNFKDVDVNMGRNIPAHSVLLLTIDTSFTRGSIEISQDDQMYTENYMPTGIKSQVIYIIQPNQFQIDF